MKYKKHLILSLLLIILISLTSCFKNTCEPYPLARTYEFVLPFELSPALRELHIGDTISISSTVVNPLYDRATDKSYQLNDIKFYLETDIYYMDTSIIDFSSLDNFELIIDTIYWYNIFRFSNGANDLQAQYKFSNNTYSISYKLIPRKKGNYFLSQSSAIYSIGKTQKFDEQCDGTKLDAKVYMNDRKDNNLDLIYDAQNPYYKGWAQHKEKYLDIGSYCFKVID